MKTYEALSRFLARERDGRPLFGLMGDANLAYLGHFIEQLGGNYRPLSIESAVVLAADGWARFTGEVGIATVTFGPALTNALTALTEAVRARTPLVLLTGDTPEVAEHYQHIDIAAAAKLAGADYERSPRAADAVATVHKALVRARTRGVPVVVDIPYAQLSDDVEERPLPTPARLTPAANAEALEEALGLLMSAKRPLVLAGRGTVASGGRDEVLAFARMIGAPVMTSLIAKDLFRGEPDHLGIFGTFSTEVGVEYIGSHDVLIAFGASLNNWQTDHYRLLSGKVIQVDASPDAFAKYGPVDVAVHADVRQAASALAELLASVEPEAGQRTPRYIAELAERPGRESPLPHRSTSREGHIDLRDAAERISESIGRGRAVQHVSDIGMYCVSVIPHLAVTPGRWDFSGCFGAIGLSIPFGIGAAYADPTVPTVVWVGDGAAMHSLMEVSTAVRDGLPLVVVILNDSAYGAEFLKLENFGARGETSYMQWPSFAELACAMGAAGHTVRSLDELRAVLDGLAELPGPTVIDVITDPLTRFRPTPAG